MTLNDASINFDYEIVSIEVRDKKRLLELGFIPNKRIRKIYESFDKKMVAINVGGTVISLRKNVCEKIIVKEGDLVGLNISR